MQKDPKLAWCDKDLWYTFTPEQKVKCIAEEVYVIATERFLVKSSWSFNPRAAYLKSLDKVCTTLCSGWFRDYAIDHYPEVMSLYNPVRFETVKQTLLKGK